MNKQETFRLEEYITKDSCMFLGMKISAWYSVFGFAADATLESATAIMEKMKKQTPTRKFRLTKETWEVVVEDKV